VCSHQTLVSSSPVPSRQRSNQAVQRPRSVGFAYLWCRPRDGATISVRLLARCLCRVQSSPGIMQPICGGCLFRIFAIRRQQNIEALRCVWTEAHRRSDIVIPARLTLLPAKSEALALSAFLSLSVSQLSPSRHKAGKLATASKTRSRRDARSSKQADLRIASFTRPKLAHST